MGLVAIVLVLGKYVVPTDQTTIKYTIGADNKFAVYLTGYGKSCADNSVVYKQVNNSWVKISDEFLMGKGNYYLDDRYLGYSMGCDVVICSELPEPYTLNLVDYVHVGEKTPPSRIGTTAVTSPVYQSVPLSGEVKVEIKYFSDENCQNKKTYSTVIKEQDLATSTTIIYTSQKECEQTTGKQCFIFRSLCQVAAPQNDGEKAENEKYLRDCLPRIGTWQPAETISVLGETTCLPGTQTFECTIGLKTSDGNYYGLRNIDKIDPENKFTYRTGLKVEVYGLFSPEEMGGPSGIDKYDIVGVINVISIKLLEAQ